MAQVTGRAVPSSSAVPAVGTPAWCDAHGHPQTDCIHGCRPPDVSWSCPLLHECTDAADPFYQCKCHWVML
jgi:hypothetical protein